MSAPEPTTGEVARRLDDMSASLRRIEDKMVSNDVFAMSQAAMNSRLDALSAKDASLEQKIERVEERRRTDRRALWPIGGSVVIAAVGWVITALGGTPLTP